MAPGKVVWTSDGCAYTHIVQGMQVRIIRCASSMYNTKRFLSLATRLPRWRAAPKLDALTTRSSVVNRRNYRRWSRQARCINVEVQSRAPPLSYAQIVLFLMYLGRERLHVCQAGLCQLVQACTE